MGAALKLDPTRIKITEFWKVQGDPLARALRKKFKQLGEYPKRKFKCVYSDELLSNKGHNGTCGTGQCVCPKAKMGPGDPSLLNHEWCSSKVQINGTVAHITAIFGFMLASLVIQVRLASKAGLNKWTWWVPVVTALLIWWIGVSPVWIIFATIIGAILYFIFKQRKA